MTRIREEEEEECDRLDRSLPIRSIRSDWLDFDLLIVSVPNTRRQINLHYYLAKSKLTTGVHKNISRYFTLMAAAVVSDDYHFLLFCQKNLNVNMNDPHLHGIIHKHRSRLISFNWSVHTTGLISYGFVNAPIISSSSSINTGWSKMREMINCEINNMTTYPSSVDA